MLYTVSQLIKVYGSRVVLDIPTLEIEKGGIYALLGPNGAGKTTLLNILGFLEPPTSGGLHYCETAVQYSEPALQPLRKEVVVVGQHPILFSTTVYKNLEFGLKIRGFEKKKRQKIIEEALELVGMRDFAQAAAHRLSGGETQRVALARAFAVSPKVLLCDEPTSSVDIENQQVIVRILRQINEIKKIAVVFTTHDRSQAVGLAQQILVLDHGRIVPTHYENIFTGNLLTDSDAGHHCIIQGKIHLSLNKNQVGDRYGKVRVFIDPEKINLVRAAEQTVDSKAIAGKVVQVSAENGKIRVVVDAGMWMTLFMSVNLYEKTRPLVGEPVALFPDAEAIHLL